jgi:hypothetical protein
MPESPQGRLPQDTPDGTDVRSERCFEVLAFPDRCAKLDKPEEFIGKRGIALFGIVKEPYPGGSNATKW